MDKFIDGFLFCCGIITLIVLVVTMRFADIGANAVTAKEECEKIYKTECEFKPTKEDK